METKFRMKYLLVLLALLFPALAVAQTTTTHLGLTKPAHGSYNWDTAYNANWDALDALFADYAAGYTAVMKNSTGVLAGNGLHNTDASTTSVPRRVGCANLSSGEACALEMGDANNGFFNAYNYKPMWFSYHSVLMMANRGLTGYPTGEATGGENADFEFRGTKTASTPVRIKAAGSTSSDADALQVQNASGTNLLKVAPDGTVTGGSGSGGTLGIATVNATSGYQIGGASFTMQGFAYCGGYFGGTGAATYSALGFGAVASYSCASNTDTGSGMPVRSLTVKAIRAKCYRSGGSGPAANVAVELRKNGTVAGSCTITASPASLICSNTALSVAYADMDLLGISFTTSGAEPAFGSCRVSWEYQ